MESSASLGTFPSPSSIRSWEMKLRCRGIPSAHSKYSLSTCLAPIERRYSENVVLPAYQSRTSSEWTIRRLRTGACGLRIADSGIGNPGMVQCKVTEPGVFVGQVFQPATAE